MAESILAAGTLFAGSYELERELGFGAMARVYLAHDRKHDRKVALKILRPELAQSIGAERFLLEIRFAAKLSHPHILPLFDSGQADGHLFYVMPNVEGHSLRDRLARESTLPVEEAVRIGLQVADALDYAHRHGVIHRDVKPENIMLHDGHALVADFGIGKATSSVEGAMFTHAGITVGTPAYMSPEQAAGDAVDGRSDVYSLGCVLYEMLVGEQPFTGPNVQAVIAKRFVQTPAEVSALRPGVSRSISATVSRALARAPADRYATASDLAAALREPDPVHTIGRHALFDKSIAVLPFTNMSSDHENDFFADGITEEILNALSHIRDLRVVGRTSAFAFKNKKEDLGAIAKQLQVRTVLDGSVRRAGTRVRITAQLLDVSDGHQLWSERYDREIQDVFAVQDEIATAIAARMETTLAGAHDVALSRRPAGVDAYEAYLKGRALLYQRGTSIKQGMDLMTTALSHDPNYGLALAGLADAYSLHGIYTLARTEEAAVKARSFAERALEVAPNVAEANAALAMVRLLFDWRFDDAERLFVRALALNPGYIQGGVWYHLFYLGSACGRWAEAIDGIGRVQNLDRLSGYAAAVLGVAHAVGGDADEALHWADKALELAPYSYLTLWTRQTVFTRRKEWTRALEASDAVMTMFGRRANTLARLCGVFAALGQVEEARAVYDELRARATLSKAGREYVSPVSVATAASAAGEMEAAIAAAREAFALREPQMVLLARSWPEFEYLRAVPEFQEILAAMNLPE